MAKIYISSTYSDLKEYREKVYQTLRKMQHDAQAMEDYVASDRRPLDKCLADVAKSDLYVGIFAWRYGYIPSKGNPQQKSITELEYRKAEETGKSCLIFLLHEEAAWLPKFMDKVAGEGESGKRIEKLRQELSTAKLVSFFKTPDELAHLVAVAVQQWEQENASKQSGDKLSETASAAAQQTKYDLKGASVYGFAPEGKDNVVIAGEKVEGNTIISDRRQIDGDDIQGSVTHNNQSVIQNIGTNTGQAQAIAAGRDVNATQQTSKEEGAKVITQEQAVEILSQIEKLIKEADLPSELTSQATKYAGKAKEEASEEKPEKSIIVRYLERATSVIKKADTTAGAAKNLVDKLKPLILKLAGWLGVAANHFFG